MMAQHRTLWVALGAGLLLTFGMLGFGWSFTNNRVEEQCAASSVDEDRRAVLAA